MPSPEVELDRELRECWRPPPRRFWHLWYRPGDGGRGGCSVTPCVVGVYRPSPTAPWRVTHCDLFRLDLSAGTLPELVAKIEAALETRADSEGVPVAERFGRTVLAIREPRPGAAASVPDDAL